MPFVRGAHGVLELPVGTIEASGTHAARPGPPGAGRLSRVPDLWPASRRELPIRRLRPADALGQPPDSAPNHHCVNRATVGIRAEDESPDARSVDPLITRREWLTATRTSRGPVGQCRPPAPHSGPHIRGRPRGPVMSRRISARRSSSGAWMIDVSVGSFREVRIRQSVAAVGSGGDGRCQPGPDLADRARASREVCPSHCLRQVGDTLGPREFSLDAWWRRRPRSTVSIDRGHAALVDHVVATLRANGWLTRVEVTFNNFGERGLGRYRRLASARADPAHRRGQDRDRRCPGHDQHLRAEGSRAPGPARDRRGLGPPAPSPDSWSSPRRHANRAIVRDHRFDLRCDLACTDTGRSTLAQDPIKPRGRPSSRLRWDLVPAIRADRTPDLRGSGWCSGSDARNRDRDRRAGRRTFDST